MINNKKEKRIINIVFFVAGITVVFTTLINNIISSYPEIFGSGLRLIFIATISALLTLFFLWFGKEKLISSILSSPVFKEKTSYSTDGNWTISISYNKGNEEINRYGPIKIIETTYGLQINGGKLCDSKSKNVRISNWHSEYAEIIQDSNGTKLIYTYKIFRDEESKNFRKIGTVVATKHNNRFIGEFIDITIGHQNQEDSIQEKINKGNVVLFHD